MLSYLGKPIVFLACVNSYVQGKRLRYLVQWRKNLAQIINEKGPFQYFSSIQKGNRSHHFFLDKLSALGLHRKVEVLHLIGHTNPEGLFIESEEFETKLTFEEMERILEHLPKLKLVYLDGCATPELMDFFVKKDVPAVVGTVSSKRDDANHEIASKFYEYLTAGKPILEAFWSTSEDRENLQMVPVTYDVERDLVECSSSQDNKMPQGLYYFEENLPKIQTQPRKRAQFSLSLSSRKTARRYQNVGHALLATVMGLVAVGVSLYLFNPINFYLFLAMP